MSKVDIEEEIFTHEYLWRSGSKLLQQAEAKEEGSYYYLLPSLLMSYLAYEGFINFSGYVLLPELWKNERQYFRNKGIEGKLEVIVKELGSFSWEKEERPYRTVKCLKSFRDIASHAKVQPRRYAANTEADGTHFTFEHVWDEYIASVDAVKQARIDIKVFCDALLVEIRKKSDHLHLLHDAFEGSLASGSGTSSLG